MLTLCPASATPLLALLDRLHWRASGVRPWDGTFGMLGRWSPDVEQAICLVAAEALNELGLRRGTTFLAKLVPGQRVPIHTDREDAGCEFRVHVPLLTNSFATFTEGTTTFHMPPGFAYRINPTLPHSAHNGGTCDRIHLIFNAVP